ncbi:AAA family ATPase [Heliobacillus mobilis]|uniref:AAA family ATPase n=1 Tax=Heliobacterium mobile TaxID=28064 RepID=A0A6I3SNR1_HELMO|nr:AAA family ATPase [Heliobacterium mobile]MTV50539.1 AAA family ATPase [Heliobacterium mobile]
MIKDFSTAYWGYLPTTKQPYPANPRVNAFVGSSGHGKTTIFDGIRMVLGDTTFESKRTVAHYIHKKSNWAIVRVAFHNEPVNGVRPFERHGYRSDEVTVCCRVFKHSDGRFHKEYSVFDGAFYDINELARNPKAYKEALMTQDDYRDMLEDCLGITPAFRKLMAMNPDSVKNMVELSPSTLFQRIFELKGLKDIKDRWQTARERYEQHQITIESEEKELKEKELIVKDLQRKAKLFHEYQEELLALEQVRKTHGIIHFWELMQDMERLQFEISQERDKLNHTIDKIHRIRLEKKQFQESLDNLNAQISQLRKTETETNEKIPSLSENIGSLNVDITNLSATVNRLSQFPTQNLDELHRQYEEAKEHYHHCSYDHTQAKDTLTELHQRLHTLQSNRPVYPKYVSPFVRTLQQEGIEHLLLAEAIRIKPEFKKWQQAVEAYLGQERFRIIVSPNQFVAAKKLQETHRYTARVSEYRKMTPFLPTHDVPYPSILSVLEISEKEKVGGYLTRLHSVFLVDTVEQGHELAKKGIVSITQKGLQQDGDGAIFRDPKGLCCGTLAIQAEIENTQALLAAKTEEERALKSKFDEAETRIEGLEKEITLQQELQELPEKVTELEHLQQHFSSLNKELASLRLQQKQTADKLHHLYNLQSDHNGKLTRTNLEETSTKTDQKQINDIITSKSKYLVEKESSRQQQKEALLQLGLTDNDIDFIPQDIHSQKFKDTNGNLLTSSELFTEKTHLEQKTSFFATQYPDINEATLQNLEVSVDRVERLKLHLNELEEKRVELQKNADDALHELKGFIKSEFNEYTHEFSSFAELLQAKGKGRIIEVGENPDLWELHMSIGFDGKEPVPIDSGELSSGQKACTSLLLLLAAVNNRKEHKKIPIMFLDEPKARVDDDRGNEVGQLLQATDIQYFITHQQGESLKTVNWIDHAYHCKVCHAGKDFADPMIFQRKRM